MTNGVAEAVEEIACARAEVEAAVAALMDAVEHGQAALARTGTDPAPVAEALAVVLSTCVFGDLVEQRLARAERLLTGAAGDRRADAHLLNGPAAGGLDQSAADALFASLA
jgi:hypothetical protein